MDSNSRTNRYEKKRKGTRLINLLAVAGSVLVVAMIAIFLFGGGDQEDTAKGSQKAEASVPSEEVKKESSTETSDSQDESEDTSDELVVEEGTGDSASETNEDDAITVIENTDKENVQSIIKKEWEPVPTEQELNGEHRITYESDSQDWKEMLTAIRQATGLTEANMVTDWIGNGGGPNKAIATVYNSENPDEIYRVYLEWIDQTGFQVQKMEVLKELPENY